MLLPPNKHDEPNGPPAQPGGYVLLPPSRRAPLVTQGHVNVAVDTGSTLLNVLNRFNPDALGIMNSRTGEIVTNSDFVLPNGSLWTILSGVVEPGSDDDSDVGPAPRCPLIYGGPHSVTQVPRKSTLEEVIELLDSKAVGIQCTSTNKIETHPLFLLPDNSTYKLLFEINNLIDFPSEANHRASYPTVSQPVLTNQPPICISLSPAVEGDVLGLDSNSLEAVINCLPTTVLLKLSRVSKAWYREFGKNEVMWQRRRDQVENNLDKTSYNQLVDMTRLRSYSDKASVVYMEGARPAESLHASWINEYWRLKKSKHYSTFGSLLHLDTGLWWFNVRNQNDSTWDAVPGVYSLSIYISVKATSYRQVPIKLKLEAKDDDDNVRTIEASLDANVLSNLTATMQKVTFKFLVKTKCEVKAILKETENMQVGYSIGGFKLVRIAPYKRKF